MRPRDNHGVVRSKRKRITKGDSALVGDNHPVLGDATKRTIGLSDHVRTDEYMVTATYSTTETAVAESGQNGQFPFPKLGLTSQPGEGG
jgi:hypothetical protein